MKPRLNLNLGWLPLAITVLYFFCFAFPLLERNFLYWDHYYLFTLFRENMHAVNRYGEIAWWFPHIQSGWPASVFSLIGPQPFQSLTYSLSLIVAYVAGLFGKIHYNYMDLYVFSSFFLLPLLFNYSVYQFLAMFVRNRNALVLGLILGAFGPGLMLQLSDPGIIEDLAYTLFLVGAWLRFYRTPDKFYFRLSILAAGLYLFRLNYSSMFFSILAIPTVLLVGKYTIGFRLQKVFEGFRAIPLFERVLAAGFIAISVLPVVLVFSELRYLEKDGLSGLQYGLFDLLMGDPREWLFLSIPGIGFTFGDLGAVLDHWNFGDTYTGRIYLGILALPLFLIALFFDHRRWRMFLAVTLAIFILIPTMGSYNPIFLLFIKVIGVFRSNRHWHDLFFRSGGFFLLAFGAVRGFQILMTQKERVRRYFWSFFAASALFSTAILFQGAELHLFKGLLLILVLLLAWSLAEVFRRPSKKAQAILMMFVLADILLVQYVGYRLTSDSYFKRGYYMIHNFDRDLLIRDEYVEHHKLNTYMTHLMMLKTSHGYRQHLVDTDRLPRIYFSPSAFAVGKDASQEKSITDWMGERYTVKDPKVVNRSKCFSTILVSGSPGGALPVKSLDKEFLDSLESPVECDQVQRSVKLNLDHSFNRFSINVESAQAGFVFLRNGFHPNWSARVNGVKTEIERAFVNFQALPIQAGTSRIELEYSPTYKYPVLVAWWLNLLFVLWCAWQGFRRKSANAPCTR